MPPGVAPLVDAQCILNQQCIPGHNSQSHCAMYSEEHLQMVQSGLPGYNMVKYNITIKKKTKYYKYHFTVSD